jgi:hypothetical protein
MLPQKQPQGSSPASARAAADPRMALPANFAFTPWFLPYWISGIVVLLFVFYHAVSHSQVRISPVFVPFPARFPARHF